MEHLIGQGVQIVRQTMLKQEAIFKEQLRELHRIYNVQKHLMDEIKRGGLISSPVSCRDRSMKFPADSIGQYKDFSYGMPFEGSSSKLKLDCQKKLRGSAHEDINLNISVDVFEKPAEALKAGGTKARKLSFDLELLPEEYMADEVTGDHGAHVYGIDVQKTRKENVDCTSGVFAPRSSHEKLDLEHARALKRSRCAEEGCLPISEIPSQFVKRSVSSEQNFLGVLKLEKSLGQESRSSRSSDTFSGGSKKKGRASLNSEDVSHEMRKIQRESQGCMKSQGDSLSGSISDQHTFMQDFQKSKASSHLPKRPGDSFSEGNQAGQQWWKSSQTHRDVELHSSKGIYDHFPSNAGGQSQESSFSLNPTNYGIQLLQGKVDSAQKVASFQSWREKEAAVGCFNAGMDTQAHGIAVNSGRSLKEAINQNCKGYNNYPVHSIDTGMPSSGEKVTSLEAMTGPWYQSRTDFPSFPQFQQHLPPNPLHTAPVSSPLCVSLQTPNRVASNATYFSSAGLFSMSRDTSLMALYGDGVPKSSENFATNSWSTASGGSNTAQISVAPAQKRVLDGIDSSDKVHHEVKVSREEHFKLSPRDAKGSLGNSTDQNIGQPNDLGSRETLKIRADFSGGGQQCGRQITQSEKFSIRHAGHGLSRAADLGTMKEFSSENKAINSHDNDSNSHLELRSESLLSIDGLRTDGFKVVSIPAPCGESLSSSKTMRVRQDIHACHKTSMTVNCTELLQKSESLESEDNQPKLETTKPYISTTADKLAFSYENAEIVSQVKQEHSHFRVQTIDHENAEAVTVAIENDACSESEFNRPLVAGESLQGSANLEKLKITIRSRLRKEDLEDLPTGLGITTLLLQETEIVPLTTTTEQQSFKKEEQPLTVAMDSSVPTEKPKKLQACVISESLARDKGMDSGALIQSTCQVAESKLLTFSESLHLTKPEEDIVASFGSTLTIMEDILKPKCAESLNHCESYDSVVFRESSKPPEVVEGHQPVATSIEYHEAIAIVPHSSTITGTASHPTGQHSSEACSLLYESSTNAVGSAKISDERINAKSKFQHVSRNTFVPTGSSPEGTSDDDHSLCLDESANLAASILVSLLPNALLPPKSSEKKRACNPLQKSFSSSADQLAQLRYDQRKCGSHNTLRKFDCSPSGRLRNDALPGTLQSSSLDGVSSIENMKRERPMPDIDSTSFNMKGGDNASHEDHRKQNQDKAFSQKVASTKRTKLSKECHHLKTLPRFSSLTTPDSLSGESSDVNAHLNAHFIQHGNVAGCATLKENNFEGEGSNQVVGQQASKPEALDNSEEEDLWNPGSQQVDSEDEASKCQSKDPSFCIKSWGDSTRKRRMQRHRNPAFHKRQKSHKISLSKLHS